MVCDSHAPVDDGAYDAAVNDRLGRGEPPIGTASTGWTVGVLVGLAAWVGVTLFSIRWATPQDDSVVTRTAAIAGAVFFTVVYAISIWKIRSFQRSARVDLYERLAIVPVSAQVIRASMRGVAQLSLIYIAFGAVVTALGLTAVTSVAMARAHC